MGVGEAGRQLQPVAESAVHGDMRDPDRRDLHGERIVGVEADEEQDQRPDEYVEGIVDDCAYRRAGKVTQHRQVGRQDQQHEELP